MKGGNSKESILYYPNTEKLLGKIVQFRMSLESESYRELPLYIRHNDFAFYGHFLNSVSLGVRAVRDAFGMVEHFDVDTGFYLVADKVSNEDRAFRLERFPEIAREQNESYLDYLPRLQATLSKSDGSRELATAIETILQWRDHCIPLYFLLNADESRAESITPTRFRDWLAEKEIELPPNIGRKIFATELYFAKTSFPSIEASIGHNDHLDHPFGVASLLTPWVTATSVSINANEIIKSIGFRRVSAPIAKSSVCHSLLEYFDPSSVFDHELIGFDDRVKKRKDKLETERRIYQEAKQSLDEAKSRGHIKVEHISEAVQLIVSQADAQGVAAKRCLGKLYRWLDALAASGTKVARRRAQFVSPESSPFSGDTLNRYSVAQEARSALREYILSLPSAKEKSRDISSALNVALIIACAALIGGQARKKALENIPDALHGDIFEIESGRLVIWFNHVVATKPQVVVPEFYVTDDVTSALISRYKLAEYARNPSRHQIDKHLRNVCRKLGCESNSPMTWLARIAEDINVIESPGLIRGVSNGSIAHRTLDQAALTRLMTQKSVHSSEGVLKNIQLRINDGSGWRARDDLSASERHRDVSEFITWFRRERLSIKASPKKRDKRGRSKSRKHALAAALGSRYSSEGSTSTKHSSAVISAASFISYLCEMGTSRKSALAWRTISEYSDIACNILFGEFAQLNLNKLSEIEYEDAYFHYLGGCKGKGTRKIFWVMRELHHHLMELWQVENIDWSYVASANPDIKTSLIDSIDANVITYREYLDALHMILGQEHLKNDVRYKCALMVVLGYRYGLRWSEALHLEYRDLQVTGDLQFLEVRVRPNTHRTLKSRNAPRTLPLIGQLSDIEKDIIGVTRSLSELMFEDDAQCLLFNNGIDTRGLMDSTLSSFLVNNSLRVVSGEKDVRFHHLRHTAGMRMTEMGFSILGDGSVSALGKKLFLGLNISKRDYDRLWWNQSRSFSRLRTICEFMGHAGIGVSLTSYVHHLPLFGMRDVEFGRTSGMPLLSGALGMSFATLRKRRSRLSAEDKQTTCCFDLLTVREKEKILSTFCAEGEVEIDAQIIPPKGTRVSLGELDKICGIGVAWGFSSERYRAYQDIVGVEQQNFFMAGLQAERETAFDHYRFLDLYEEQTEDTSEHVLQVTRRKYAEDLRIRSLCESVQKRLDSMGDEGRKILSSGLSFWGRSAVQGTGDRDFVIEAECDAVNRMFEMLGLDGVRLIKPRNQAAAGAGPYRGRSAVARENPVSWRQRGFRATLSLPKALIKTRFTLERLLFLLSLKHHYDEKYRLESV